MKIKEIINSNNLQDSKSQIDVLEELSNKSTDIFILRNYFSREETDELLRLSFEIEKYYTVYDGFDAFPRPFDHIPKTPIHEYQNECLQYHSQMDENITILNIQLKLKLLSDKYSLSFNNPKNETNFSETWSSFRRLKKDKGYFEVHCGRLFQEWNDLFFQSFSKKADINTQFAFLLVLQRPETDCDIEIFDAKWDDYRQKQEQDVLIHDSGNLVHLSNISSEKIKLFEGDLLLFDEGNYWHLVPPFKGDIDRVSFGGFITKMIAKSEFLVWS